MLEADLVSQLSQRLSKAAWGGIQGTPVMHFGVNGGTIEAPTVIAALGLKFKISPRFMALYGHVICCLKRSMSCLCLNLNYATGAAASGIY